MQSIKSTGIKLLIYWKSTKKAIIRHNSCLVEMILGKCGSSLIPVLVLKKKVRAHQRNYLTLSNQTTPAIQKSCPIYSTPTFVSIGQQLASNILPSVHHTYPVRVNGPKNLFLLHDTFVEEVNMVINNLLVSKCNRQNDIPTRILNLCKNSLSPFLVQIFDLCVRERTYPQSLKCAQVVPIY